MVERLKALERISERLPAMFEDTPREQWTPVPEPSAECGIRVGYSDAVSSDEGQVRQCANPAFDSTGGDL